MKKIMIVDDEPHIILSIKEALKESKNDFEVIGAQNGTECIEMLDDGKKPDLIILDIMMPGMNGWDVAAKIKENPQWSNIPIVFVTAKGDAMSVGMGSMAAEDYITKPFDIMDLKTRVERVLSKH